MPGKNTTKSMDIQKPGSAAPDSTSKPIIVTNRPILQDPMVKDPPLAKKTVSTEQEKKPDASAASSYNSGFTQKIIMPAKHTAATIAAEREKNQTATPTNEPKAVVENLKVTDSMPSPAEEAAAVNAIAVGSGKTEASNDEQLQDADEKRRKRARALADSKKYVVPIGRVSQARHDRQAILLLIFLLAGMAGYAAFYFKLVSLPAGLLK